MLKAVKDILEKKLLEFCILHPKATLIFNDLTDDLLAIGHIVDPSLNVKKIAKTMKRNCFFYPDKHGYYKLSLLGKDYYSKIKDRTWSPAKPPLRDGDLEMLKKVTTEWQTMTRIFGKYHYKYESAMERLTAHGLMETRHYGKVLTGMEVYSEPELKANKNRCKRFYRRTRASVES